MSHRRSARRRHSPSISRMDSAAANLVVQRLPDEVIRDLRRAEHARKTRARVSARTDEVEVADLLGLVVRSEVGRLRQDRFDRKGRTQVAIQHVLEMAW